MFSIQTEGTGAVNPAMFWIVFSLLVQAEHVPLEDELEALCRLHVARAELVLSGDLERFIGVASTVEAFAFTDSDDSDEGEATDFNPPPAMFAFSLSAGDDPGGAEGTQERLDDGRKRRLAALENCLDAFDRLVDVFLTCKRELFNCVVGCTPTVPRRGEVCRPTLQTSDGFSSK